MKPQTPFYTVLVKTERTDTCKKVITCKILCRFSFCTDEDYSRALLINGHKNGMFRKWGIFPIKGNGDRLA